MADLLAVTIEDIHYARGQQVSDQLHQDQDGGGRLLRRLQHNTVSSGEGRRQFPAGHQQGKVPGNDLPDHAQRFVEMVADGSGVDLRRGSLLRADTTCEIAEMVDQ